MSFLTASTQQAVMWLLQDESSDSSAQSRQTPSALPSPFTSTPASQYLPKELEQLQAASEAV